MGSEDFEDATREFDRVRDKARAAVTNGDVAILEQLGCLSPLEYGRLRKAEAQRLNVPVGILDREIKDRKKHVGPASNGKGKTFQLVDVEPAPGPVDGQRLMEHLTATIQRYVILPAHGADAVALWILRTHAHDLFDVNPRLALVSPEKRCGKTTLLELLERLTPRAVLASNITPSAIFRVIEAAAPTLLIDEMDSFSNTHEELRGILNSGHRRAGAKVVRTVGDEYEPREFSTWCPMVLATIGRLPDTLEDRSISIPMRRRAPGEAVTRLRWTGPQGAALRDILAIIASGIARWVLDHQDALCQSDPILPETLHDRAADNWSPLFAIADVLGGDWPERANAAALVLSGHEASDSESDGVALLRDIQGVFQESLADSLRSHDLCDQLTELEERPWKEWRHGKPLSPAQFAKLLKPFGVRSRNIRQSDSRVVKGYHKADFQDAFTRYIPSLAESPLSSRYSATSCSSSGDEPLFQSATEGECSVSENGGSPALDAGCSGVAAPNLEMGEREDVPDEKAAYLVPAVAGTQDPQKVIDCDA